MDNDQNRRINSLFNFISQEIYKSDQKHSDGWWPIRPTVLDYPIAPYLFGELIRLFRKADNNGVTSAELASLVGPKDAILDLQFLWPCLSWKKNDLSFEDKLYLMEKLISLDKIANWQDSFVPIYDKLAKETPKGEINTEEVLKAGTRIYFGYLQKLSENLGESWEKSLKEAIKVVLTKYDEVQEPQPVGDLEEDKAIRTIFRNCDFRREKEKDLEQLLTGIPQVPGIAEGVVGENIAVVFNIESEDSQAEAYVANVDAFQKLDLKDKCFKEGIVVVGRTRVGTNQLKPGTKVWVDGTSGIVYGT